MGNSKENLMNITDTPGHVLSTERKINWIASYPKSGSTWVRMFLNAYATGFPLQINSAFQYTTIDLKPEIYQMMMPRPISELTILDQFMYHQGALLNLIKLSSTKNVCVKTHNAKAVVENIQLIPPQISGPSVYLIRDPRDVVISHAAHFNESISDSINSIYKQNRIGLTEFNLGHMFMDWSSHVKSWTINNKDVDTLVVKYENLFDPEAFKSIIKQLGLDFDNEKFLFAIKESEFANLQKYEKENTFNEKKGGDYFFRVGKKGQWKDILTKSQIKKIITQHKEMMEKYGYI